MNRPLRSKLLYVCALVILGAIVAALVMYSPFDKVIVLIATFVVLLIPGRIQGFVFRDHYRGRRLMGAGQFEEAIVYFEKAFKKVDFLLAPVSPTLPFKIGAKTQDPLKMYLSDVFTVTANLAGIPGLSLPAGFVDQLPVGIQLLGPQFSEELLFRAGYAYEQATDWRERKPSLE